MPPPTLPPTPAASTDIKGQDGAQFSSLQMSFELPPPAMTASESRPSSASAQESPTDSSYNPSPKSQPAQPATTTNSRRRTSAAAKPGKDAFALPPPPTRSRKIIQMKPRQPDEAIEPTPAVPPAKTNTKATAATSTASKKKQPSSTSVAGRKIARKTAHSLIERRRRSKMNEEFGVLKSMIPACTGEMHKLAILQASIDYVRYLEDCIAKLKAQNNTTNPNNNASTPTPVPGTSQISPEFTHTPYAPPPSDHQQYYHNPYSPSATSPSPSPNLASGDEDIEMSNSHDPSVPSPTYTPSPAYTPIPGAATPRSHHPSPSILPQDARDRNNSYSSVSTDQRHYSYSASATTSPIFGPQYGIGGGGFGSVLTSPALMPQRVMEGERDFDQEATQALLMLGGDRRGVGGNRIEERRGTFGDLNAAVVGGNGNGGAGASNGAPTGRGDGRGMSVRDMLSA